MPATAADREARVTELADFIDGWIERTPLDEMLGRLIGQHGMAAVLYGLAAQADEQTYGDRLEELADEVAGDAMVADEDYADADEEGEDE